ncbi:B9 domain [Plasmopara halstedii]|uniref:B9 domain n=1 Tax=Plasmopara halstedii TaxID=4781 RepID=A0A0P1ASI9_PLAHL|nr:B9 domain [Plasmopara halstedii]CEG44256.1 B9 domain [Plasmopara halstedii]|eukprot:XP_024580625.1 B9 domain [Plasmopara halstedii]
MPVTQYYHVRDPVENLLVSVTLRKISGFKSEGSGDSVPVGKKWKYCFQWQEKKLSSREKKLEQERLKGRENKPFTDKHEEDTLSSYVDEDNFIPDELAHETLTTSNDRSTHLLPPDLSRRPSYKRTKASWSLNQHRTWLRANREDQFRAMHIVALIEDVERILCSFRYYKSRGLLCATPGFSLPISEPGHDPDLLAKGPKLSTYHVTTRSGSVFEYVLENVHDIHPCVSAEEQKLAKEIQLREEMRDREHIIRYQQSSRKISVFDQKQGNSKSLMERKMMLSIEVVAVNDPQAMDPIFVKYELELPRRAGLPHWKFYSSDHTRQRGTTSLSLPQRSAYPGCHTSAILNHNQQFYLKFKNAEKPPAIEHLDEDGGYASMAASPVLRLAVYSCDPWHRKRLEGHGEIKLKESAGFFDQDIPLQKPFLSISDHLEELFLGVDESAEVDDFDDNRPQESDSDSEESPISNLIISRLGQKSESTGATVRLRYIIIDVEPNHHTKAVRTTPALPFVAADLRTKVVQRSVHEILRSVRREKRLATITDPQIQAALRSLPNIEAHNTKAL